MRRFISTITMSAALVVTGATTTTTIASADSRSTEAPSGKPSQWGSDLEGKYAGPGNPDYYCTYQVNIDAINCAYSPGAGVSKPLMVKRPPTWWNPWTWF